MTIEVTSTYTRAAGNGLATVFNFPFKIFSATDLIVSDILNSTGTPTVRANLTDYTVVILATGEGGTVTMTVAPAAGHTLDIRRLAGLTQDEDIRNQGRFLPEIHEGVFDKLEAQIQDLSRRVDSAFRYPDYTTGNGMLNPISAWYSKYLTIDGSGNLVAGVLSSTTVTAAIISSLLTTSTVDQDAILALLLERTDTAPGLVSLKRTLAESAASVTPSDYSRPSEAYDFRREGQLADNVTDDTVAVNNTLLIATQTVAGAQGNVAAFPATGNSILSSMVTLPNRVRVTGGNKRGSYFKAKNTWNSGTSPWMFNAKNGTSSMFDSTLENLTVDANNIAGLGCVLSDAWQDDCGLRGVLLINFATSAIKFQNGYGGAAMCKIIDCEIFGGTAATTGAGCWGIDVELLSIAGAFMMIVEDTSITGLDGTHLLDRGINMVNDSLTAKNVHFEYCSRAIYVNGNGNHQILGCNGSTTVTTLVEVDALFSGTLRLIGCARNGSANLIKDNRLKQIATFGAITAGAAYVNGTYTNVPLTGGSGTLATATIGVAGGAVTSVGLATPGTNYAVGDVLSAANSNLGGAGAGFSIPVFQIFTGVGTLAGIDLQDVTLGPFNQSSRALSACVAWGTFDGTVTGTNAPTIGYNIASIQRTGTGRYTVNLSRALASINCSINVTQGNIALQAAALPVGVTSFTISVNNTSGGTAADSALIMFQVFGS